MISVIYFTLIYCLEHGYTQQIEKLNTQKHIREFEMEMSAILREKKHLEETIQKINLDLKRMKAKALANSHLDDSSMKLQMQWKEKKIKNNRIYYQKHVEKLNARNEFISKVLGTLQETHIVIEKRDKLDTSIQKKYPIEIYERMEKENNGGVSFHFTISDKKNLICLEDGVVIYVDDLTTFGKIIMIEYNDQWKSVYLGQITTSLEKGMKVLKGDTLGVMSSKNEKELHKLYYELRHGDKIYPLLPKENDEN